MASRFWVGGTGTWDAATTTHWSASTGGAGGASVPTAADDVFIDGSSGSPVISLSGVLSARSVTTTGATCTLDWGNSATTRIGIGDGSGGALTLSATTTCSNFQNVVNGFNMVSTSTNGGAGWSITTSGITIPSITFNGVGGKWILAGTLNVSQSATFQQALTVTAGTFDTNNQAINTWIFSSSNSNIRTITLGSSVISVAGTGNNTWDFTTSTNLTFNAGTSTITLSGVSTSTGIFHGGGQTYWNVSFTGIGTSGISEVNTFNNLTVTGGARAIDTLAIFANQTISNILTLTGNSVAPNRLEVVCNAETALIGTARTITVNGSVSLSNVNFQDIVAAGTAGTWTGTSLGDLQGNSNITFTVNAGTTNSTGGVFRYWNGGAVSANWSDSKWSTTSGGSTGASVPLPQDTAVFPASSITGTRTITWDMRRLCHDLDLSALGNTAVSFVRGAAIIPFFMGNVTLSRVAAFGLNGSATYLQGRGSQTITSGGNLLAGGIAVNAPGGTYTFQDDTVIGIAGTLLQGTIDHNNKNITYQRGFVSGLFNSTRTWKLGTGTTQIGDPTATLGGITAVINISNNTGFTLVSTGSNLVFAANSDSFQKQFTGLGLTWGNVTINAAAAGGLGFDILGTSGTTTYSTVTIGAGQTVRFSGNALIIYAATAWNFVGTSGSLLTVISINSPTRANLSQTSGTGSARYTSLKDNSASGGATFVVSPGIDAGNNAGWIFPSGFGQAQAKLNAFGVTGFGQAQADVKVTSRVFAQAQADIKAIGYGFAQSQADIKAKSNAFAQAQADIKAVSRGFAQAQADIKVTSNVFAQTQADIKATSNGFAQTQADINATSNGYGQTQADVKATSNGFGQSQTDIKATSFNFGQSQADIKVTSQVYGQAQADIKFIGYGFGQAQSDIKATSSSFAQAQADIKQTSFDFGQAQVDIKQTYFASAQSHALIKVQVTVFAQAQTTILKTTNSFGQANADILQTYTQTGNAQADIKVTVNESGQAQADIRQIYRAFGQTSVWIKAISSQFGLSQAFINRGEQFAQAQAFIFQPHILKNLTISDSHPIKVTVSDEETARLSLSDA